MIVAIDKDFNRIHIEDAVVKQECYCPYCGERLSQKRYTDRRSHFAHYPKSVCKDSWAGSYDMSDWHYDWQNSFPKKRMDSQQKLSSIEETQTAPVLDTEEHLQSHIVAEYGNLPVKTVKSVEQILNENYDQEEYLIYDMVGFRRMKCVVCGAIQHEKEFVKHDTCNKGTCRKCTSGK